MTQAAWKIFGTAESLESQADEFLDHTEESSALFLTAVKAYLETGSVGRFVTNQDKIKTLNQRCDELCRAIESHCYAELISPDLRGDLLSLFEQLSCLIKNYRNTISRFASENPNVSIEFHTHFISLTGSSVRCIESMAASSRSYLRGKEDVRDNIHKAIFYGEETEALNTALQGSIFSSSLPQIDKIQHRYFAELVAASAIEAEIIARQVAIFAVKGAF